MKKLLLFTILLNQFSWGYCQKKQDLQLVYCEELILLTPMKFYYDFWYDTIGYNGPFIDGYLQLRGHNLNKTQIEKINKSLKQWAGFGKFRSWCEPDSTKYVRFRKNCDGIYCNSIYTFTIEEMLSIKGRLKKFGDTSFRIKDTLNLTTKYSEIPSVYLGNYIYNRVNDSVIFLGINKIAGNYGGETFQHGKFIILILGLKYHYMTA